MKYAFFPGCKIPYYLEQYGRSTKAVLAELGVELIEMEFNCCGYPIRNFSFEAFILSAARNLALAESRNLTILTPCKCCYGSLRHADHWLREQATLRDEINRELAREGLDWKGSLEIRHLLTALAKDVGLETVRKRVRHPFRGLKVAVHYGCHALRPGHIVRFDNPLAPRIFEDLVAATGAECVSWSRRLECCGNPLWEKNSELSMRLMHLKLADAGQAGAHVLCTSCTYCQMQFDEVQAAHPIEGEKHSVLPALLYSQLLGLSLGLPETMLGLDKNRLLAPEVRSCYRE